MGSILGITWLTDKQEAALVKLYKYAVKAPRMINRYRAARDRAIENYRSYTLNPDTVANYESAWNTMPAAYEAAMSAPRERLIQWLIDYSPAIFNREITRAEAEDILNRIEARYRGGRPVAAGGR